MITLLVLLAVSVIPLIIIVGWACYNHGKDDALWHAKNLVGLYKETKDIHYLDKIEKL